MEIITNHCFPVISFNKLSGVLRGGAVGYG